MADLEDKKVSQLESGTVTSNSVFLDSGNGVSTKVGSQDVANFVGKTHAFSGSGGLNTTAKTLVGAINEVAGSAGKSNLADMDDVNIDDQTLEGGQTIIYDDTNDEWVNGDVASTLESLTDVDIDSTSLADGQAIVYDETNDKWVNGDVASGASANEALPYDENTSYVYGSYCTNLNYLWRCTSPNGATGTWDTTKWVAVMITDEYKRVRIMTKAQFDLLSADEKDGFIYVSDYPTKIQDVDNVNLTTSDNNKLLGVSVSGSDISVEAVYRDVRSTTEKRVGTWINGKPLYEKIIAFTNSASSMSDYVQVEQIPNIAIATQLNWTFKRVTSGNTFWYTGSGSSNPEIATQYSNWKIAFRILNGYLEYGFVGYSGSWLTDCYVTIQYTKTTD